MLLKLIIVHLLPFSLWFLSQVQFLVICLHSSTVVFMDETCRYPKIFAGLWSVQNVIMFFLFTEFYIKSYRKKIS
jgi:hypothetical protein